MFWFELLIKLKYYLMFLTNYAAVKDTRDVNGWMIWSNIILENHNKH